MKSDTIDIVSEKVNNEIHLKAEDVITDGKIVVRLLIQNVSEANDIDYVEHILTININDGVIDYQGDNNFPTCAMNDKTIIISNPKKLRISGIQIKENTAKRNMKFDVNDFAYTCDIDALHKKIDSIFEQSHSNKESIAKIMNTYPTVDETNEALEQLKETMIDKENLYTSDKIILDSEGLISFDTTLNDSNDETIMTSKSTSKLLKAINSYLNKKFVEAEGKYTLKSDIPEIIEGQTTIQFKIENNTISDLDYDKYHEMIEQYGLDIVSSNNYYAAHYVHVDYSYNNDKTLSDNAYRRKGFRSLVSV
ncbi:hypothetical protein M9Y10_003333 [Tritrichomonas musculus]|uniref:BppU N-terminal domain-containing protein n=1 Tax=Tritrichomonas musculus TaxID=1915356 RepID=A0ABR2JP61_9EUKA